MSMSHLWVGALPRTDHRPRAIGLAIGIAGIEALFGIASGSAAVDAIEPPRRRRLGGERPHNAVRLDYDDVTIIVVKQGLDRFVV